MLGGLLEYNSMYFGFANLYLFAMALYGTDFAWSTVRHANIGIRNTPHENPGFSYTAVITSPAAPEATI